MRSYQRAPRRSTRRNRVNPCLLAVFTLLAGLAAGLAAAQYPRGVPRADDGLRAIGSTACRTCHRALFQEWQTSPHGRSAQVLTFEQSFDSDCTPCHVPDEGVFDNGVGCEACHGPGSAYAELDVMIDPLKRASAGMQRAGDNCAYCHNPGHPFHVERDLEVEAGRIHRPGVTRQR